MATLPLFILCCLGLGIVPSLAQPDKSLFANARFFGATNFTDYLVKADLDTELKNPGNRTVFAPLNEAFAALPADVSQRLADDTAFLKQVMSFHIVNGRFISPSFQDEELLPSSAGSNVRINKYTVDESVITTASGSQIKLVDISSNNGYLFIVNKVVYPAPTGTALDYISSTDTLSTLLLALSRAGISQLFTGGDLTLFAPSDAAFSRLPPGELDNLLDDIPKLQDVLKLHMVKTKTFYTAGLVAGQTLTAESGGQLSITRNNGLQVNGINVSITDISVNNGVVHTIDRVLLPPSYKNKSTY